MKVHCLEAGAGRDKRGWRIDLLRACGLQNEPIGDLHAVSLEPGACRGNHFHPDSFEWLLVFGGPAVLAWRKNACAGAEQLLIEGNRPHLFEIPAGVEHAVRNRSGQRIYLVALRSAGGQETVACGPLFTDEV